MAQDGRASVDRRVGLMYSTDSWHQAAQAVKDGEAKKELSFFAIGVEGADMGTLAQIATALWLPWMALWLWRSQHRVLAAAASVMCAGAIYASALAANGFLSSTVGETIAERHSFIEQRASLARHKENLERDLAAIQLPPIITTDAGIATLEAAAKSKAEARERECLRPGPICHQYENEETELRKKLADVHASRAAYDRADKLKEGITADQHAIDALPVITNADPQAASMAAFLQWASFGRLGPSTNAVGASRIGVVVIFLALPGFLLMLCGLRRTA